VTTESVTGRRIHGSPCIVWTFLQEFLSSSWQWLSSLVKRDTLFWEKNHGVSFREHRSWADYLMSSYSHISRRAYDWNYTSDAIRTSSFWRTLLFCSLAKFRVFRNNPSQVIVSVITFHARQEWSPKRRDSSKDHSYT
jgi:hypothetical protein